MLERENTVNNRVYDIYYNNETGEIKIVYEKLDPPSKEFKHVESLEHNPAETFQLLQNKAIQVVAGLYPTHDIGPQTRVTFLDEQPYGDVETPESREQVEGEKPKPTRKAKSSKGKNS